MNWRLVANLVIIGLSLVLIGVFSARSVIEGNWLLILAALAWSLVAVFNLYIAVKRIMSSSSSSGENQDEP